MTTHYSFLNPTKRSATQALIMIMAFVLLLTLELDIVHLQQLQVYGASFWIVQVMTGFLAVLLPYFQPIRASIATLFTATFIIVINLLATLEGNGLPLQYELLTLLILFSLYILLSYVGESRDRQELTSIFCQYIPPELVAQYSQDPQSISLNGEARELTVLFCDIYGFTSISEKLEPQVLAKWLNRYFTLISQIVVDHGGTLDKYIGDSVMAFWGAPVKNASHASDTLSAALMMQEKIAELSEEYKAEGLPEIKIGIGISTGIGNVGNMGSEYRMAYTVVGDTVNMAQRLERQTRDYNVPIIVSQGTVDKTSEILYREIDTIQIKGKQESSRLYQPMCYASSASQADKKTIIRHDKAISYLSKHDLNSAAKIFKSLQNDMSGKPDPVYDIYLKRINKINHQ